MTDNIPDAYSPPAVRLIRTRNARHESIVEGTLPTTAELLDGAPFFKNSIDQDIHVWCELMLSVGFGDELSAALKTLRDTKNAVACALVVDASEREFGLQAEADRLRIYAACMGDRTAAHELKTGIVMYAAASEIHSYSNLVRRIVGEGLSSRCFSMDKAYAVGLKRLADMTDVAENWTLARLWIAAGEPSEEIGKTKKTMPPSSLDGDAAFLEAVIEDRAESVRKPAGGLVVVPLMTSGATSHKRDLQRSWATLQGKPMPLIARGDVGAHRESIVRRWPHAADIVDVILSDLAASEAVRFRPTLIVGPPGSGKSSLVKKIAEVLGLPYDLISLAGSSDSAMMGTSAQWSTARESMPLQLIKRSRIANPAMIWDEIEKASPERRNGSALDALLPMFERDQATSYFDLALEVPVNLSMISHFATANDLSLVPPPLRDRMRVLTMPEPTWEHAGTLVASIVEDLMFERGLDFRWIDPFAEDEMQVIRQFWDGGSVRRLMRIVERMIDGRERNWGNA